MPINCLLSDSFQKDRILQVGHMYVVTLSFGSRLVGAYCYYYIYVRAVSNTLQTLVGMLCNGKAFEGTVDYAFTDMRLQLRTGRNDTTCISRFVPAVFPNAQTIYRLLLALHKLHLCCFLTGSYALYVAGRLDTHDGLTLIVALAGYDSLPILRWLMQVTPTPSFTIYGTFQFTLLDAADANRDLYLYSVSCDDVTLRVSVLGIDADRLCGPLSNVDLVHFVWEEFMRFTYKRYAFTLTPQGARSILPRLTFVKHYRVESDGWKDRGNCDDCRERNMDLLLPFHECDLSSTCTCKICTRQPPSLADCARHVLFLYTMNLGLFRLRYDTTYDQYVYAVRSNRVPPAALLPPQAPRIGVTFLSGIGTLYRYHRDCLSAGGERPWVNGAEKVYASNADLIRDLVTYRRELWCHHCEKGLFFPVACFEHADTLPVHDGADVAQMADVAEADLPDDVISNSDDDAPQLDSDEDMFQVDG